MENRGKIISIVVVAILLVIAFVFVNQSTGQATLTPGANYGPVNNEYNLKTDCVYVSENDGWDVTKKGEVQFFDKSSGVTETRTDHCEEGNIRIREWHCEGNYAKSRLVQCPDQMTCKEGVCIAA